MANPQYTEPSNDHGNGALSLHVERKVMGSLASTPGDTVLAYTPGVSPQADVICSWLNRGAEDETTALYAFLHPENGLLTLAFARGAAIRFGSSRAYTTRSVYEIDDEEHARIGRLLTPLVMAMPPLMAEDGENHQEEANLQVDNRLMVPDYTPAPLTDEESRLSHTIRQCIRQNKKLMIQLGDDKRQLLTILHAIDALPDDLRRQATLGYDVSGKCAASRVLAPYLRIIAHHDDLSGWRPQLASTIVEDWRRKSFQEKPAEPVEREKQVESGISIAPAETVEPKEPIEPEVTVKPEIIEPEKPVAPAAPVRPVTPPRKPSSTGASAVPVAPRLDRRWWDRYGKLVKWLVVTLVAIVAVFTLCKRCTEIGSSAASDIFVPASDKGFVRKSNLLLQHLVDQGKDCPKELSNPKSLEDLMKRYPALVFALPYGESDIDGARAADLRLVGIRPEKITDEDDKRSLTPTRSAYGASRWWRACSSWPW